MKIARSPIVISTGMIAKNNFQSFKVEIGYLRLLYMHTREEHQSGIMIAEHAVL